MKKVLLILALVIGSIFILSGCEDDKYIVRPDHTPPSSPKGVYSITADRAVWLFWEANDERDLAGYRIYRTNSSSSNKYYFIAKVDTSGYVDYDVDNGETYYYAITAFDYDGNESDLSKEVYDTPRPEGKNQMYDRFYDPSLAGFDFSKEEVLHWEDADADIYLEYDINLEAFFLCVANNQTDIQDFGYTDNLDDVDWSPLEGWSNVGWVEVIKGHSYIVWTANNHYAKLRVREIVDNTKISFSWAYQIDAGNQELMPRPPHAENYLKVAIRQESAK